MTLSMIGLILTVHGESNYRNKAEGPKSRLLNNAEAFSLTLVTGAALFR